MREILFRGKRTDNKQWVEGFYVLIGEENPNAYIIKNNGRRVRVAHKSVSQYTGLTDKNGKKIFDGDIIKDIAGRISKVEYYRGRFYPFISFPEFTCWNTDECEVIGNIHDNPELLKGGK